MAQNPFDQSYDWFNQAGQTAQSAVSPQSRDRAAARLRASMDLARDRRLRGVADEDASRGRGTSGLASKRQDNVWGEYYNSLSQGMGTLENDYANQSLNASNAMSNAGQGISSAATNQANAKNTAMGNFLQGGNVFADPYGGAAQNFWGQAGIDISGLRFFDNPGTTNPISVNGGTNVNVGTGGTNNPGGGTTIGGAGLDSNAPIDAQGEAIVKNYRMGSPVVMSKTFIESPLGNYIYNRLIALTGNRVRIAEPSQYPGNAPFMEDTWGSTNLTRDL